MKFVQARPNYLQKYKVLSCSVLIRQHTPCHHCGSNSHWPQNRPTRSYCSPGLSYTGNTSTIPVQAHPPTTTQLQGPPTVSTIRSNGVQFTEAWKLSNYNLYTTMWTRSSILGCKSLHWMSGESWLAFKDSLTHQSWFSRLGIQCFLFFQMVCFIFLSFHFLNKLLIFLCL